ncbi:hypothetical protein AMTR_s00004p00062150 [Amborella trichopoda]|uniref:Uncharacterized protein n=1 Tax=Amborella trichopoda TaxID=13333 RepID=W1NDV2_AMBTC|nr:hypothetical protein AMTR_s00004p00062150 [Amborella trichopoda]
METAPGLGEMTRESQVDNYPTSKHCIQGLQGHAHAYTIESVARPRSHILNLACGKAVLMAVLAPGLVTGWNIWMLVSEPVAQTKMPVKSGVATMPESRYMKFFF